MPRAYFEKVLDPPEIYPFIFVCGPGWRGAVQILSTPCPCSLGLAWIWRVQQGVGIWQPSTAACLQDATCLLTGKACNNNNNISSNNNNNNNNSSNNNNNIMSNVCAAWPTSASTWCWRSSSSYSHPSSAPSGQSGRRGISFPKSSPDAPSRRTSTAALAAAGACSYCNSVEGSNSKCVMTLGLSWICGLIWLLCDSPPV